TVLGSFDVRRSQRARNRARAASDHGGGSGIGRIRRWRRCAVFRRGARRCRIAAVRALSGQSRRFLPARCRLLHCEVAAVTSTSPLVVAITGASGAPYAVRLLQALTAAHRPVSLIVSKYGLRLLATEAGIESMDALRDAVGIDAWASYVEVFSNDDRGAAPA